MNDDLISRKALLDRFRYGDKESESDKAWICAVRRMIKEQTTAFDKEKVIEELKAKAEDSGKYWSEFNDEDAFGEMNAYIKSIEIIDKGGIE